MKTYFAVTVLLIFSVPHFQVLAIQYEIVDLGTLGGAYSKAYDINNENQIVGYSQISGGDSYHACLWESGSLYDIGTLHNYSGSIARGINDDGKIVGYSDKDSKVSPFIYRDNTMNLLALPTDHEEGVAFSINSSGAITGHSGVSNIKGDTYSFINDGISVISITRGNAYDVNNNNSIVGEQYMPNSGWSAYIYKNNQIIDLVSLLGEQSVAYGINDFGQVAGWAYDSNNNRYAYMYEDGAVINIGSLGGQRTSAYGINNNGEIVGTSETEEGTAHAFLYSGHNMYDLETLPGHSESYAMAINEAGWIVGYSQNTIFDAHAVLWKPIPGPTNIPIDIKPSRCPNRLNIKSKGKLSVAILGADNFDVNEVDVLSIRLAGVAPLRSSYKDVATPLVDAEECDCSTEGSDGYIDLTLKFDTQAIVAAIGEVADGDELLLELIGELFDGTQIKGEDCIIIHAKPKPKHK